MSDLTRWNRAGLSRFEYLDGNAAVFLERLRAGLAARFPGWDLVQATIPPGESEDARKARLEALYAADPDDMLWQLTRSFARACHVLGVHVDAYANEGTLGTASQWENLRRLVALLDYAPRPPASASAALALLLKDGKAGTVAAGFQVRHSPAKGAPLVFETLADLDVDAAWNVVYARDRLRSPDAVAGHGLVLAGRLDKLKAGDALVLEDERSGRLSAHLIDAVTLAETTTAVTLTPAIPSGFVKGWTRVHAEPKEKLKPLGPATTGVSDVGHGLQLAVPAGDLAAGDLVVVRSVDDKPYFRRIKTVHDDRLVFHEDVGRLTLAGATVARTVTVPLTDLASPPARRTIAADGTVTDVVFAAGDWSRLAGQWLADIRKVAGKSGGKAVEREYLPAYRCLHAKYVPVGTDPKAVAADDRPGYTALTLTWHPDTDGVPGKLDFKLVNPQTLLAPPAGAGPWIVDRFLNPSADGHLPPNLVTVMVKQTAAGDLAVVVKGAQLAWARLAAVALDREHEEATLTAAGTWQDRGGGPLFLSRTRVHAHFATEARIDGWQVNATPLSGTRVVVETLPAGLKAGRAVIADNGAAARETRIKAIDAGGGFIDLADPLPGATTAGTLAIYANVVTAGHGESRAERVLGSGDGTRDGQRFTLDVADPSFVADATMAGGVRADLVVTVAGETWTQVDNLKDSASTDAHYQVRIDEDGKVGVQFGDGRHGRRLPTGGNNVRVRFRQGVGAAGNLAAGCLVKPVKPHPLIDTVRQPIASGGGADREGRADLRNNAPATLLALDRAVSLADFAQLARGHASVWQAQAFRRPPGLGQRERVEVVVMAAGGGVAGDALKADLRSFLAARAQPGVAITVSDYQRLSFSLKVTLRVRLDAFDAETVKAAVTAALAAAFADRVRQLGQPLYRGEVYRVVDDVAGVENSDCEIVLDPATESALAQEIEVGGSLLSARPGPGQCLVLAADGVEAAVEAYQP